MRLLLAASTLLLAAAPGFAGQRRSDVPPATPTGPAVSCIPLSQVRETKVRDGRTIDFLTSRDKGYRNTLDHECPSLGFERRFLHKSSTNQYCAVDIITVLTGSGLDRGASCGLGKFQPVTFAKRN